MLDAILAQSRNTALIMGLIAMIGLLLQKKHASDADQAGLPELPS